MFTSMLVPRVHLYLRHVYTKFTPMFTPIFTPCLHLCLYPVIRLALDHVYTYVYSNVYNYVLKKEVDDRLRHSKGAINLVVDFQPVLTWLGLQSNDYFLTIDCLV